MILTLNLSNSYNSYLNINYKDYIMSLFNLPMGESNYKIYTGPIPVFDSYLDQFFTTSNVKTAIVLIEDSTAYDLPNFYKKYNIKELDFPIRDMKTPETLEKAHEIVLAILKVIQEGDVYVHCMGGHGRTGLVMACLSSHVKHLDGRAAIKFTRKIIDGAIETRLQEKFITHYAAKYGIIKQTEDQNLAVKENKSKELHEKAKKTEETTQDFEKATKKLSISVEISNGGSQTVSPMANGSNSKNKRESFDNFDSYFLDEEPLTPDQDLSLFNSNANSSDEEEEQDYCTYIDESDISLT